MVSKKNFGVWTMSWSTVAGIGAILGILGLIVYAVLRLLAYGQQRGEEKTLLEIEISSRKAREQVDEITEKNETEYDEALDATTNLDFNDVNRLLFDEDYNPTDTNPSA